MSAGGCDALPGVGPGQGQHVCARGAVGWGMSEGLEERGLGFEGGTPTLSESEASGKDARAPRRADCARPVLGAWCSDENPVIPVMASPGWVMTPVSPRRSGASA